MNQVDPNLESKGRSIKATMFATPEEDLTRGVYHLLKEYMQKPPSGSTPYGIMLSGGKTPVSAYYMAATFPFKANDSLRIIYSDDRHVPPDNTQSNFGNSRYMLSNLGISMNRVLRVCGELPLDQATLKYQQCLDGFVKQGSRVALGLLGLGTDGHTASLFSKEDIKNGEGRWAISVNRPDGMKGISVTPAFLEYVDRVIFLVNGREKRGIARRLAMDPYSIPAGMAVAKCKSVELWTDKDAWPFE